MVVVDVSPTDATVRPEFAAPGETGRAALPVPGGGVLRAEPPAHRQPAGLSAAAP